MRLNIGRLAPLALVACALLLPGSASAKANKKQTKKSVASAAAFLEAQQQPDGSFFTDWDVDSLGAAGVAAADLKPAGGKTDARSWYQGFVGDTSTWPGEGGPVSEFDRAALLTYASGIDPARVSKAQNLIAAILAAYQPSNPGYYGEPENFTGTIFALLALAETKTTGGAERLPQALFEKTVNVLRANQHDDGGWTFERAEGKAGQLAEGSEPDETGAAIAALCSAGVPSTNATIAKAIGFLEGDLASNGAFNDAFGINTDSNAWGVQGLDACGVDPQGAQFTSPAGDTPVDFLISEQEPGGGFKFSPEESEANEYSTQDALRSLAGAGFTAAPPKPSGGAPRWVAAEGFQAGTHSALALVIDNGTSSLKACSVAVSPATSSTTLGAVLEAAEASSSPSGCVSSFMPSAGKGSLTQVNGRPSPAKALWNISIDGAKEKEAKLSSKIELGDTISLKLS
jgi:hypothetical protein